MSLWEANSWFLAFLKVSEAIFSTFSGPIRILGQKSTKIAQLKLGMCLLTHFMAKTVLRKEFARSEFMVLGLFEGQWSNIFHFSGPIEILAQQSTKYPNYSRDCVSSNPFDGLNRISARVYMKQIYGFWPFLRSENQHFPLFLVPFESWHKNLQK